MTLHAGMTPDDLEIKQREWEGDNISAGVERYRATLYRTVTRSDGSQDTRAAEMGDTKPGMTIIRDVCQNVIPAIEAARQEALDAIANAGRGRPADWWWLIAWLPADALAFIATRVVLSQPFTNCNSMGATPTAINIARAVQDEIEFRNWRQESRRAAKEDEDVVDVALLLMNRCHGQVSRRQFSRWRSTIKDIKKLDWTKTQRLSIGLKLIELLIEYGGGWFELKLVRTGTKTERRVFLTDLAMQAIANLSDRAAFARPYLMPMVVPPRPWTRKTLESTTAE